MVDGQAMYCLTWSESSVEVSIIKHCLRDAATKPFMIGSSAFYHDGCIFIAGGGATCFSMGTFWETNVYQAPVPTVLKRDQETAAKGTKPTELKFISSHRVVSSTSAQQDGSEFGRPDAKARITTIPRISLSSTSEFEGILRRGQPVVIENLHLGDCIDKWTAEYIVNRVGSDKKVSYHYSCFC